jgi:uncharacterized membrane protein YqaE (UPF0057 family)
MKKYKFYLMGICTILFAYIIPIFAQWYEQQTGICPVLGVLISLILSILGWAYEILKEFEQ